MHVFEADRDSFPLLAPDGLTVIIMPRPSLFNHETAQVIVPFSSYLWNHDAAQFHPVRFNDKVRISWYPPPRYSPDGELFACLPEEKKTPTSESETHELAILSPGFQRSRRMELPSHLP